MIEKEIIVHFQCPAGWKVKHIYLDSNTVKELDRRMMDLHENDLYKACVELPETYFQGRQTDIDLKCTATLKSTSRLTIPPFTNPSITYWQMDITLTQEKSERYIFIPCDEKSNEWYLWQKNGLQAHLCDLLYVSNYDETGIFCEHMEDLLYHRNLTMAEASEIIAGLSRKLHSRCKPVVFLHFVIIASNILKNPNSVSWERIIDMNTAHSIITSLNDLRYENIKLSCQKKVYIVIDKLINVVLQDNCCPLTVINVCYPFFDEKEVLRTLTKAVNYRIPVARNSDAFMKTAAVSVCKRLYKSAVNSGKEEEAGQALEKLIRHLPFLVSVEAYKALRVETGKMDEGDISYVNNKIYASMTSKLDYTLISMIKNNDLIFFKTFWTEISEISEMTSKFRAKLEDGLVKLVSSYSGEMEFSPEIVQDLISTFGFFQDPSKQMDLLKITARSPNEAVNKLFIFLTTCPEIAESCKTLPIADFKELCHNFVVGRSIHMSKQYALSFIFERLGMIWSKQQIQERTELLDVLESIMVTELDKYKLPDLIEKAEMVEHLSKENRISSSVYKCQVKSYLETSYERYQPEEIIQMFSPGHVDVTLDSLLKAELLCLVIESYGGLDKSANIVENFRKMSQRSKFWTIIFRCKGTCSRIIHDNGFVSLARQCVSKMVKMFREHDVQYDFFCDLENSTESTSGAKRLLQIYSDEQEINQVWSDISMSFKIENDKLRRVFDVLQTIANMLGQESLPSSFHNLSKRIYDTNVDLQTGNLTARKCIRRDCIWKDIIELPDLCENLELVVSSKVFWNVCSTDVLTKFTEMSKTIVDDSDPVSFVTYLFEDMSVDEISQDTDTKASILLLQILEKTGIDRYQCVWKELLEDPDILIENVYTMFGLKPNVYDEIKIARRVLHLSINDSVCSTLKRLFEIHDAEKKLNALTSVFEAFGIAFRDDEAFSNAISSFEQLIKGDKADFTFRDVTVALDTVFSSMKGLSECTVNIMIALGQSSGLIKFLQKIRNEDIRNLIGDVEDISEQQVSESTVSALIEVKRYLQPLLMLPTDRNSRKLVEMLDKQTRSIRSNAESLPSKIDDCMRNLHNLMSFYNNVANRGEQTKEMIANIIHKGVFHFQLNTDDRVIDFSARYTQNKTKEVRQTSVLLDLRSRALLFMNAKRKDSDKNPDLESFVEYIDVCIDIANTLFALYSSGHVEYMHVNFKVQPNELQPKKDTLNFQLNSWLSYLNQERQHHFLMNFIQGPQIHILYNFLETNESNIFSIQTMLKFIHPHMQAERLKEHYDVLKSHFKGRLSLKDMLSCIGQALHDAYHGYKLYQRPITSAHEHTATISEMVQAGKLFIAQLDEGSRQTIKTVIALYCNTTQRLPESNQTLFCTKWTTWDQIDLLIRRCIGAEEFYGIQPLFCIANVELLSSELQFKLVDALRHMKGSDRYLLAILCRGSRRHPFVDELNEYVEPVTPATDKTVRTIFLEHCPDVLTLTSDKPGQGKTTFVEKLAHSVHKGVVTFHVSGVIRKVQLIEKLVSIDMDENNILHVDIGNVDDPVGLDTFLFELLILRFLSSGQISVCLGTKDVKIEIANTLNDTLKNSLQIAVLFPRKEIKWLGIDKFAISKERNSSTQIVCQCLNALDRGILDTTDCIIGAEGTSLSRARCKLLLKKYLDGIDSDSYPVLHTFMNVLADQLKKMFHSSFFRTSRLIEMLGNESKLTVKSSLVYTMIKVSAEFANRSVAECREKQLLTSNSETMENELTNGKTTVTAVDSLQRTEGMIRWEGSNHLMLVFHRQNFQTLSAFYRRLDRVPYNVKYLFESQMKKQLEDFGCMEQRDLQIILQRIARLNPLPLPDKKLLTLAEQYALTADNLLKMVLIVLRITNNVPVIIMGETGCGKTSLVRYLAKICEVKLDVINIHAGISEQEVAKRVMTNNRAAMKTPDEDRWLFIDEINTSQSIHMIADIICHHVCLGKELSPNLMVLGACNPYRMRSTAAMVTAGLKGKVKTDDLSRLVYRVLPLPEMLVDYIWDFGCLGQCDEEKYIHRMVADVFPDNGKLHMLLTNLLSASQIFVRDKETATYSVSLRDVQRCKTLIKWFLDILPSKWQDSKMQDSDIKIRAIVLSLIHCYHCRFSDNQIRKLYRFEITKVFQRYGYVYVTDNDEFIQNIAKEEQRDILNRMEIPSGIACNTALQENVFVILVCIFNRIPIFVVGKPGCSKSLAVQLIRNNLRGKSSKDVFFQSLPQLYCVSFQGSESSTSDGILKVFDRAGKYQKSNSRKDVLSVVILDEIGLAEISRFNPLKVLHTLLEPDGKGQPNVAVVGISNWALDASKMNRAIHLSRTEMDIEELLDTALSISESFFSTRSSSSSVQHCDDSDLQNMLTTSDIQTEMKGMAEAYYKYVNQMRFKHFHGLRDYYSLIKFVARNFSELGRKNKDTSSAELIRLGLERNFGGLSTEKQILYDIFERYIPISSSKGHSITDLVTQNITDPFARHLMLITTGEAVLGIIEQKLQEIGIDRTEVIFGSQFEEDLNDDYSYRILSKIILCMEEGIVLILKNLENIYGSLYDMLNQNYTVVAGKRTCRVAHGPYSSPFSQVSDSFKCIVLVEEHKLDFSDPPFLNRFEKQYLRFDDIIEASQKAVIDDLETWIAEIANMSANWRKKKDVFPVYSEGLVPSLVLKMEQDMQTHKHGITREKSNITGTGDLIKSCKKALLWIIRPEVMVCLRFTHGISSPFDKNDMINQFFDLPVHGGLSELMKYHMNTASETDCLLTIVFTNSNIHTKVPSIVNEMNLQIEKIGAFKSEKQLSSRVQSFWESKNLQVLIVHCSAKEDGKHLMLTKQIIERFRWNYQKEGFAYPKHVYLLIHLDRSNGTDSSVSKLNYLSNWNLVMLDTIESPCILLPRLCEMTLLETVQKKRPLCGYIQKELFWAFSRIKYGQQSRDVKSVSNIILKINQSSEFLDQLDYAIWGWIQKYQSGYQNKHWQLTVASDLTILNTSAGLVDALERFVLDVIKGPLAKLIYQCEKLGILESFLFGTENVEIEKQDVWISLIRDEGIFSIQNIPNETGPECYISDTTDFGLSMPFSLYIYQRIEETKEDFLINFREYKIQCFLGDDDDLPSDEIYEELLLQQEKAILHYIPNLKQFTYTNWAGDYFDDFCSICSYRICPGLLRDTRIMYMKRIISQRFKYSYSDPFRFVLNLHTVFWIYFPKIRAELMLVEACWKIIPNDELDFNDILVISDKNINENKNDEKTLSKDRSFSLAVEPMESTQSEAFASSFSCGKEVEEDSPDYVFVDTLCRKMLPTRPCLQYHGNIYIWSSKVTSALSLAYHVSRSPGLLYSLRLCCEIANELIVPFELDGTLFETLGYCLSSGNKLDSEEVFKIINKMLLPAFNTDSTGTDGIEEVCRRLFSSYFVLCISADSKTTCLKYLCSAIQDKVISEEFFYHLRAPFNASFEVEDSEAFTALITSRTESNLGEQHTELGTFTASHNSQTFRVIDELIKQIFFRKEGEHPFLILLVDLIKEIFENDRNESDKYEISEPQILPKSSENEISFSDDDLKVILHCHKILTDGVIGIRYITASAFIKCFVTHTAERLSEFNKEQFQKVVNVLDVVVAESDESTELNACLKMFTLTMLGKQKSLCKMSKFVESHQDKIKLLNTVCFTEGYCEMSFEKSALCAYINSDFHSKIRCYKMDNGSDLLEVANILKMAKSDVNALLAVFSFAARQFYFKQHTKSLDDSDRSQAAVVIAKAASEEMEEKQLFFLKCITGETNFLFQEFILSEECSDSKYFKLSFFIPLFALCLAECKDKRRNELSTLALCLLYPDELETCFPPGFSSGKAPSPYNAYSSVKSRGFHFTQCECGNRLVFYEKRPNKNCVICKKSIFETQYFVPCARKNKKVKNTNLWLQMISEPFLRIRDLQPISGHVLQMVTKVCLLGSLALRYCKSGTIETFLDISEIDICDSLWESIETHWKNLCELVNIDSCFLAYLLHAILLESKELLIVEKAPRTEEDLIAFELQFENVVNKVLNSRCTHLKDMILQHDRHHNFKTPTTEQCIREINCSDKRFEMLQSLYRTDTGPTKQNFRSELYPKRKEFPLLCLILEEEDQLQLPQHILHIVKWHSVTIAKASYLMKKYECMKMCVQDFLDFNEDKKKSDIVRKRFDDFRNSWEYLRNNLDDSELVSQMHRIHDDSKMEDCIIFGKESVVYRVIQCLLEIQNGFLDQILGFAQTCDALKFLFRDANVAVVSTVNVSDVKREELITCDILWKTLLNQESQPGLSYSKGKHLYYNFHSIEQIVAISVCSGKAYLGSMKDFPKIVFVDELHKTYSSLIKGITSKIRQEPLPHEIVCWFKLKKEDNRRMATDLLTHLGQVMTLLGKTKSDQQETSLVKYIDGWKLLLTREFPIHLLPSQDRIKLCHVVALCELLEELCAESVQSGVRDEYRRILDGPLYKAVLNTIKDKDVTDILLKAIKRFLYRCVSVGTVEPSTSLRNHLSDESFWPLGCYERGTVTVNQISTPLYSILPDGLMVHHTYEYLKLLENYKTKTATEQRSSSRQRSQFDSNQSAPAHNRRKKFYRVF